MTKHREHRMAANSMEAYRTSDFSEREQQILAVLSASSCPLTDREVAQRLGKERGEVQPRITEMLDEHILTEGPTVKCTTTGKPVRTVAIAVPVQGSVL